MNAKLIAKTLWRGCKKHLTKILAGTAIASELIGYWFMHKEAPIVRKKLDAMPPEATLWEKVKIAGPVYAPALLMLLVSSGCIIGGCIVGEKAVALMTAVASASEAKLIQMEKKMVETLGEEKAQEMHAEMAKEMAKQVSLEEKNIEYTSHGGMLFYDKLCSRYFTSSEDFIQRAAEKVNRDILGMDMWASVNQFYEYLDLKPAKLGEGFGWNVDHPLQVTFYADRSEDGRVYEVIVYYNEPRLYNGQLAKKVND